MWNVDIIRHTFYHICSFNIICRAITQKLAETKTDLRAQNSWHFLKLTEKEVTMT